VVPPEIFGPYRGDAISRRFFYIKVKANCCQGTAMQKKQKGEEQWQRN